MYSCLDFIKFRDFCKTNEVKDGDIFIDDLISISYKRLAHIADEDKINGKEVAQQLLNNSINEVITKLSIFNSGLTTKTNVDIIPSNYSYTGGVISSTNNATRVMFVQNSNMGNITINKLLFKPAFNGSFTVTLNDGETSKVFTLEAVENTNNIVEIDYSTFSKFVKITTEAGKDFYAIESLEAESCGCGGAPVIPVVQQGLHSISDVVVKNPYSIYAAGFLQCDNSKVICHLMNNKMFRLQFSLLVAYTFAVKFYQRLLSSTRINDTTINIENVEKDMMYLDNKSNELLNGSKQNNYNGLGNQLKQNLSNIKDYCVTCSSSIFKSKAIF
jgi:hypothetical protein